MRIVIELDGAATAVKPADWPATRIEAQDSAADAGAAPGADAASAPADSDGGGPSADLLDSIAAAERASGDGSVPTDSTDAGAAPAMI
jgi:hypothetical protein